MADSPFSFFLNRENSRMVRFLEKNRSFSTFVADTLDHLTRMADEEGVRPEDIQIADAYFHAGRIVANVRVQRR